MPILLFIVIFLNPKILKAEANYQDENYAKIVQQTALLSSDRPSLELAREHKLNILNVTWEDTGRAQNSTVGPNISDMTIQAHLKTRDGKITPVAMPVIRFPNFSDKTADISPNEFFLMVGNETGESLKAITLADYLDNFRDYLSKPKSWKGDEISLLAARDTHVLVSPQATILPVPPASTATFNPVLFNYQSYEKNPAVLAIIATREGTSATIIDNKRDSFRNGVGQRLFFNKNGNKASFTAQRADEVAATESKNDEEAVSVADQSALNMVLLIQVPLVHKERAMFAMEMSPMAKSMMPASRSSLVDAVIGHGPIEGPFTEIDNLPIVRDERFPIRVTVQFYKASAGDQLTAKDLQAMTAEFEKVFAQADFVGSLVLDGKTNRPTEHDVEFNEPVWWPVFWKKYEKASGHRQADSLKQLKKTYGKSWPRWSSNEKKLSKALEYAWSRK